MTFIYDEASFARDAQQQIAFLTPQMYRIESEVYQVRYPSFDIAPLMHVNEDGDMWDIGSVFYSGDVAGAAQWIAGRGFDMPYASVAATQHVQQNHLAGIGYEWSLQELERAAKLGRNLSTEKAAAASKVAQQFKWAIAMTGNTEKGLTGLVNNASVPAAQVANDGTGPSRLWSAKTPDQILRDVDEALEAPFIATKEVHLANTLLLPTSRFNMIARTRLTDTDITVMDFLRQSNAYTAQTGQPLTIRATRALETAGTGNGARMITYDNSREVVQFHLPGEHEFLSPFQKSSMTWEVAGIMNIGGLEIRLPKAIAYRDSF
jgi:hypothetical protein